MTFERSRLSELLTLERRKVAVHLEKQYAEVGVYCFGRGLFHKEPRSGFQVGDKPLFEIKDGDFILQVTFAWEGAVALAGKMDEGYLGSVRVLTFRVDENRCLPEYLTLYFRTPAGIQQLGEISPGSAGRNRVLNKKRMSEVFVPLPSLPEQRRIVEKVERLAAKIADASRLRNQSVTETEIFSHNASRSVFQDTGRFARVNLEEVCLDIIDCLHSNPVYCEDGIPTVRSPDVGWGRLSLETARRTTYEEYCRRTRRGEARPGDIILVREGGGTGKAGIVEEGQQFSLGQRVMQLRPNEQKVLPRYLLHQWLSPLIQEDQISEMMKGSASPHLNIGSLKKFQVVVPPLEEQSRIVDYLDGLQSKVEQFKQLQAQTAAELDALLPSILDKAFQGDL